MTILNRNRQPDRTFPCTILLLACSIGLAFGASVQATEDWPQWGGPSGDFKVQTEELATQWPEDGPHKLWSRALGDGYSAIVSDGKTLYTMYWEPAKAETKNTKSKDSEGKDAGEKEAQSKAAESPEDLQRRGREVVIAIDAKTGKTVWTHKYEASWTSKKMNPGFGPGPNSTPLIIGDRLFTVGATVKFFCLDRHTGKKIWEHDLVKEFEANPLTFGYGVSPCSYKDTVILSIGGKGHSVLAFKQDDGALVWKAQDFQPAYGTPQIITVDGEEQLLVYMATHVAGLNPNNGDLLWQHKHGTGSNICTPVFGDDNIVFVSSSYGVGSRGIKLIRKDGKTTTKELWFNPKMKVMHANAIRVGDQLFASSNEWGAPAMMAGIDIHTGKFVWRKRGFSKATCLWADKKLIVLDEDGNLAITQPKKKKLKVLCKHEISKRNSWTVPTMLGSKIFIRDRHEIKAFDLSKAANKPKVAKAETLPES